MAFNFPDTPSLGQIYSAAGGPTWVYDGGAWVQAFSVGSPPIVGAQVFNSFAQAEISIIDPSLSVVYLAGYYSPGDNGGAQYRKVVSEPAHEGKFQSADGAWWELAEQSVTLEMFGGKADGVISGATLTGTDNSAAMAAALAYGETNIIPVYGSTATIRGGRGKYAFYSPIKIKRQVRIIGATGAGMGNSTPGTHFQFPLDMVGIYIFAQTSIDPDTLALVGTAADGTVLEALRIHAAEAGSDRTAHGICMRARAIVRDCSIVGFAGDGINIVSNDTTTGISNVNKWEVHGGRIIRCQNGIYVKGGDANVGTAIATDTSNNRQCGILDRCFLGNTYIQPHHNGNGQMAQVSHGGNRYRAVPSVANFDTPSLFTSTTPGTDSTIWELISVGGVSSFWPAWSALGEYAASPQQASTNANCRSTFIGTYDEGGWPPCWLASPAMAMDAAAYHPSSTGARLQDGTWRKLVNVNAQQFLASLPISDYEAMRGHNTAAVGGAARVRFTQYLGYKADGVTERPLISITGRAPGATLTDSAVMDFEYYDAGLDDWKRALTLNGDTLVATPGTDAAWDWGSFAAHWDQTWTTNIHLLPPASVTPANNGEVTFQLTSDTSLTFKVKGLDGVVRSGSIALA